MTTNIPGFPANFQASLPVASTMTTQIPGRMPSTDTRTNVIIPQLQVNGKP